MKRLLLLILFLTTPALADVATPDTPAGHVMGEWFAAFNAGDRASLQAFFNKYHHDKPVDDTLGFRVDTGGLTLLKVESSTPGSVSAFVQEKESDDIYRFVLTLDPKNPVAGYESRIEGIPRPAEFAAPRLSQADVLDALAKRGDGMVARDRFSGSALVAKDGEAIFQKYWGFANREKHIPVDADTRFRLGSMNKMFTAVAVLQLVAQGKVSLDGTVGTYLPNYPNRDLASKVTIRELLNHTAGAGDIFGPDFDKHRLELKTVDDYIALYGNRAPEHVPGAEDGYDNFGFVLLGAIIEKISGGSYYDYVRTRLFEPAGMHDTDSLPDDGSIPHLVIGYMQKDGAWVNAADTQPYRGSPAGGGYSTLGDLLKFANALQSGALIPLPLLAEATTPQNHQRWYGFGFETHADETPRSYGHSGGAPGMNAELRIFPDQHVVFVGLANTDFSGGSKLASFYALRMPLK